MAGPECVYTTRWSAHVFNGVMLFVNQTWICHNNERITKQELCQLQWARRDSMKKMMIKMIMILYVNNQVNLLHTTQSMGIETIRPTYFIQHSPWV